MIPSIKHIVGFSFIVLSIIVCDSARLFPAGQLSQHVVSDSTSELSSQGNLSTDSSSVIKAIASFHQSGKASYYASRFHGRSTANGESFDMDGFTAAHRTLPFGSIVRVSNPENHTAIVVMVNDRGPYVGSRVIDMARGAARCIDVSLQKVELDAFKPADFQDQGSLLGFCGTSYQPCHVQPQTIVVSDTMTCFSDAVRKHRILAAKNPQQDVFLIVTTIPSSSGTDAEPKTAYLIATRKDSDKTFDSASLLTD